MKFITGTLLTPSYAYYSPKENCVGKAAINKLSTDPQNVLYDAKRLLGESIDSKKIKEFTHTWSFKVLHDPNSGEGRAHFASIHEGIETLIPPEKVSSDILKSLLNDVYRRYSPIEYEIEAVITVPAYFNMAQKRATIEAAKVAGINVKQVLSEPVAAALAYQYELGDRKKMKEGESVFIFDLGGGTFDVTIMRIENDGTYKVVALGGNTHLGGRDFDRVTAKIIERRLRKQIGDNRVNELKSTPKYRYKITELSRTVREALSTSSTERLDLNSICPELKYEEITRNEFEQESEALIKKIKECCEKTLYDANINSGKITGALVVGGASMMNTVQDILKSMFPPEKIFRIVNGSDVVAKGATIYAARLSNITAPPWIKNMKIQDALPLSIGIEVAGNKFNQVLKHNSPIPSSATTVLSTSENNQSTATVPVCF